MKTLLPLLAVLSFVAPALADDGPPKLNIEATCKSASGVQVRLSETSSEEGCLRSERQAHDELKRRWDDFSPAAKKQCARQFEAGGYPSYVETVTCLELATGSVPAQPGEPPGKNGAATGSGSDDIAAEPSPKQRTNPIDVLNDDSKK